MCSCHSIPECCVMFFGVKLRMGSFILFLMFLKGVSAKLDRGFRNSFKNCNFVKLNQNQHRVMIILTLLSI